MYSRGGSLLELVLEDDEAQKVKTTFGLFPVPLLLNHQKTFVSRTWAYLFMRCAFSQVIPSTLFPAMAITRKPLRV